MKQIYFDQNITKKLCNHPDFSNQFFRIQFESPPKLIITPRSLIELSGATIMDCLKRDCKYELDLSESISNQTDKAYKYYKNSIRGDVIPFLGKALRAQKQYAKTEPGRYIFTGYESYLNSIKGMEDIYRSIILDRVSVLPLENFKSADTYLHINSVALSFLSVNPHIPCLRLLIKSYKKLPPANSERVENEFRRPLKKMIETSDLHNRDLVDAEIIQFAVMGYNNHPVHFYTMDSSETIKKRLFLLYLPFEFSRSYAQELLKDSTNISDTNNLSLEKIKGVASRDFIFGRFLIIDDSGYIKEDIDVKSLLTTDVNNILRT